MTDTTTVYRKEFDYFMTGLAQGERYKKRELNLIAKELEKAGTVEIHKICDRICNDIEKVRKEKKLGQEVISTEYIRLVLDEKYGGSGTEQ